AHPRPRASTDLHTPLRRPSRLSVSRTHALTHAGALASSTGVAHARETRRVTRAVELAGATRSGAARRRRRRGPRGDCGLDCTGATRPVSTLPRVAGPRRARVHACCSSVHRPLNETSPVQHSPAGLATDLPVTSVIVRHVMHKAHPDVLKLV